MNASYQAVDLFDNVRGFQICNYSSIGALTFTVYDVVASVEDEVHEIWGKPWTNLKFLYLSIRFLSLASQLISTGITLRLVGGHIPSLHECRIITGFQGLSSQLLMMAVQVVLVLRVQALFHGERCLNRVIQLLFLAEIVIMTTLLSLGIPRMTFGLHCVVTSFPKLGPGFFVTPILFDFSLFFLTMMKFYSAVQDGWRQEDIVTRLLKDGIWAFALPFACLCVNILVMVRLPGPLSSVGWSWLIAIPGFAGCRLILNMSHLLKTRHRMNENTGLDVMDTVILTDLSTMGSADVDKPCGCTC